MFKRMSPLTAFAAIGTAGVLGVVGYAFVRISSLETHVNQLTMELASSTATIASTTNNLSNGLSTLEQKATGLGDSLSATEQKVTDVQSQVGGVAQTVGNISGTVNTLQKLSTTDKELLKKYSRVYFLNENYIPLRLAQIDPVYLYDDKHPQQIHAEVWVHLKAVMDDAQAAGIPLYVKSAFRSFGTQATLKSTYSVTYGAGTANQFSADQGYSEHQLGTAVDFITKGQNGQLSGFDNTPAYQWLLNNAYRYGFVLSYPKGNSYYIFEPWHWRFVGISLATYLHNQNQHFYDLDQRVIDGYLVNIFD